MHNVINLEIVGERDDGAVCSLGTWTGSLVECPVAEYSMPGFGKVIERVERLRQIRDQTIRAAARPETSR